MGRKRGTHVVRVKQFTGGHFIVDYTHGKCKNARVESTAINAKDELEAYQKVKSYPR